MPGVNRRYFFLGSFAVALSCSRVAQSLRPRVSVVRVPSYTGDLAAIVRRILVEHQVNVAGKRVLLKPNLVEFSSHAPVNTHPIFVAAVREAFHTLGASEVRIAEGPGHR